MTNNRDAALRALNEVDAMVERSQRHPESYAFPQAELASAAATFLFKHADTIRALLTQPADSGCVMVPREPTGDMLDAMLKPWLTAGGSTRECLTKAWQGALAAAPKEQP